MRIQTYRINNTHTMFIVNFQTGNVWNGGITASGELSEKDYLIRDGIAFMKIELSWFKFVWSNLDLDSRQIESLERLTTKAILD